MSKKSLITSLVLGAVLTLSLGLYTMITAIIDATRPNHPQVAIAYTSEQTITAFSNFSVAAGNLTLNFKEGVEDCLILNSEDNTYTLDSAKAFGENSKVGDKYEFSAVATTDKHGSTKTFNVTVYKQGTGSSAEDAYLVANADGLEVFADSLANNAELNNAHLSVVEDIDLAGKNWKGIATAQNPFAGTVNANGKAIKNMTINIDASNYAEYIGSPISMAEDKYYSALTIGLFRATNGASINGLSVTDAKITIDSKLFDTLSSSEFLNEEKIAPVEFIRTGLVVGEAKSTTINGQYVSKTTTTEVTDPESGEVTTETTNEYANASVSGTINGFTVIGASKYVVGMGGVVGVVLDNVSGNRTNISNYTVNATINNNKDAKSNVIGGVVGFVYGSSKTDCVTINDVNVTLTSKTLFNISNQIGGVVGVAAGLKLENVTATVDVKDTFTKMETIVAWLEGDANTDDLTKVAGLVAQLSNSTVTNASVNANIDVKGYSAGAFVRVNSDNTITDVFTAGRLTGISVAGLANNVIGSQITYSSVKAEEGTEPSKKVATNVILSGWYSAGLVNRLDGASIIADNNVDAIVVINAYGSGVTDPRINNTAYSAGLVGYMFATNMNSNYEISGIDANVTIYNGVDMAGLVTYAGLASNDTANVFKISNCSVVANLNSYTSAQFDSSAHKVAGGVATIYGYVTMDSVSAEVHFNSNHNNINKYGVAMFGGLVARIGGQNVTINKCTTTGDAYANSSSYTKVFELNGVTTSYKQLVAGGLVGLIASFGESVNIPVGGHPTYGDNAPENVSKNATFDALTRMNVNTIKITENNANVNITIAYKEDNVMGNDGWRVRGIGSLIGIVINELDSGKYSVIDLSTNTATGAIVADDTTFAFAIVSDPSVSISTKAGVVGVTTCKAGTRRFSEGFNIDKVITNLPEVPDEGDVPTNPDETPDMGEEKPEVPQED